MNIKLTLEEIKHAAEVGVKRRLRAIEKGHLNNHGLDTADNWGITILGAEGELVVAKALDMIWNPAEPFKADLWSDLYPIEVRSTGRTLNPSLIVRDSDSNNSRYVLVIRYSDTEYEVVGWIFGEDAKQDKWRRSPNGRPSAYFVPQSALWSIDTMKESMAELTVID